MTRMGTSLVVWHGFPVSEMRNKWRLRIYYSRRISQFRWTLYFMNYIYIVYTMIRIGKIAFFRRLQHCIFFVLLTTHKRRGVLLPFCLVPSIPSSSRVGWNDGFRYTSWNSICFQPAFEATQTKSLTNISHAIMRTIRWGIHIPSHQHEGRTEHLEY